MTRLIYNNVSDVEDWIYSICDTILQDGIGEDIDIFFLREMIRQEMVNNPSLDKNFESARKQFRSLIGDEVYNGSHSAKYYSEHLYRNIMKSFGVTGFEYLASKES